MHFIILLALATSVYELFLQQLDIKTIPIQTCDDTSAQNHCADVIKEMQNGKWQLRRDLRPEDFQHRMDEDIRMIRLLGLPITLQRDDLRCGNIFPLDAKDFGLNISALCDPHSRAPCCNHKSGWCGSGQENCSCNSCTDYRNTVAAELYEFVSSSGCQFKNFTSKQACQLLSERVSYTFLEFFDLKFANSALNEVRAHLHKNNSVVAIGVGYHLGLNIGQVLNGYHKPIIQLNMKSIALYCIAL